MRGGAVKRRLPNITKGETFEKGRREILEGKVNAHLREVCRVRVCILSARYVATDLRREFGLLPGGALLVVGMAPWVNIRLSPEVVGAFPVACVR